MEVRFLRQPMKYIKKADKPLKDKIYTEVQKLKQNPKQGSILKGNLNMLRSHKFRFQKVNYKMAYQVKNNILIVYIATRENFYRDLEK